MDITEDGKEEYQAATKALDQISAKRDDPTEEEKPQTISNITVLTICPTFGPLVPEYHMRLLPL